MRNLPFKGECNLGPFSSLRKLMRASRRGFITAKVPDEKSLLRHAWYRRKKAGDALRSIFSSSPTRFNESA